MDATIRNLNASAFRKFKAKCAEENVTMGEAASLLMEAWCNDKVRLGGHLRLPSTRKAHVMKDLSEHLHTLRQWSQLAHESKKHKRGNK